MPEASALEIAVAVVVHDGRVLVGRRSATAAEAAGLDEFPGGKLERGETPAEAAARECLEETGIAIRIGGLLDTVESTAGDRPLTVIFLAAAPVDPAAVPTPPFAWTRIADLRGARFPQANAGIVAILGRDHGGS